MKPKYNTSKFLNSKTAGASLVAAITICFGGSAFATDWDGSTSTNWNDDTNWVGDAGTGGSNAIVNLVSPKASITANFLATPVDIFVGTGGSGRLDHSAGTAQTGGGNWMFVGHNGGTGVYNLADTSGSGGATTGFAQGTGTMNVGGRLYIGGQTGSNSNGTVNVNTTGTLALGSQLEIGTNNSVGVLNLDQGTITNNNWAEIGNGGGSTGTLNMSGGTISKNGNDHFIIGANGSNGFANITGGTINVNNEFWVGNNPGSHGTLNLSLGTINNNSWAAIGRAGAALGTVNMTGGAWNKTGGGNYIVGDNSPAVLNLSGGVITINGEFWVGQAGSGNGTMNLSGSGSITNNNWVAVGRDGGTGAVAMTGGTWTKTGGGAFIIGASGPGTVVQSAGLVDVQAGDTWMGEGGLCNYTLSGTGEFRAGYFQVARNGGSTGNVNFDGGTLRVSQIAGGGGTENVSFNGTQIIAKNDQPAFISGLNTGTINAGGLLVDSNNFALGAAQVFGGTGGVVKSGAGTLNLSAANTYSGNNTVNGGKLVVNGDSTGTGNFTLANGAALGINQNNPADSLDSANVTFGTSGATTLDLNLGNTAGNPSAPPLNVTGTLALNGTVTINIADQLPAVSSFSLINFVGPQSVLNNFVLGTLPNGVVATLDKVSVPGSLLLNITSVKLPRWNGDLSDQWDTGIGATANWIDLVTNLPTTFTNSAPALFDDNATGTTAVVLNGTVSPSSVTFSNIGLTYSLSGTGKITGSSGLLKTGEAGLTISTVNDYTGVTTLSGGTTSVGTLTNGGVASPLGAATAATSNLALAGGTLDYTGGAVSINRGIAVAAADNTITSGINLAGNLTTSGAITASFGKLIKSGPGTLTLTNPGANILANGSDGDAVPQSFRVADGGLVFDAAGQTNTVTGRTAFGSATGTTTVALRNGATFTGNGRTLLGLAAGADTTLTVSNNSSMQLNDAFQISLSSTAVSHVVIENSGSITKTGGWLSIGNDGTGTMTVKDSGSLIANGDFNVSDVGTSTGTLNIQDAATVTTTGAVFIGKNGAISGGTNGTLNISSGTFSSSNSFFVASSQYSVGAVNVTGGVVNHTGGELLMGRNGAGTWTQSAGSVSANGWTILGRDATGVGTMSVSGGVFTQTQLDRPFMIGEFGIGVLNVNGTAQVNSLGANGLILANEPSGTGTVNLNSGTLTVRRVREGNDNNAGAGGSSTFHFNGGVLKAGDGANANFMSGLDSAVVDPGGAFIDTNNQTVAIGQALDDNGGDLTKQGLGTLLLNGANSYFGTTTVALGTLGGTGSIEGALVVPSGSSIAPGVTTGTFTAGGGATVGGTYVCEIDGVNADKLAVIGSLNITGSTIDFNQLSAPAASVFIIASYSTRTGTFATVTDLPSGYTLDYNYLGGNQIALVQTATPYSTWASSFGLNPFTDGAPGADADGDGEKNSIEFALGGSPTSGSNNAKVYHLELDSSDVGTEKELLLTIAVRSGAPAFAGSPSPTSTHDGATYTIQGTSDLASFASTVNVVTPVVTTGLPAAPAGYEYRTFSLNGSNGLPTKGFLRVNVTQ